jgi:AraC-like DNA-binding protein
MNRQEQVKFWREPVLGDLELLRARYVTHTFSRHTHDGYAIGVIESGVEAFTYQGASHQAPAGSIVMVHPGEVHTGHAGVPEGWVYRMLYPEVSLLQKAAVEVGGSHQTVPYFPSPVIHDAELAAQLRRFHTATEESVCPLERESRFLWTLSQLMTRYAEHRMHLSEPGREHRAVQQVRQYLETYYAETISLEHLSQLTHLKPLRLLRVFQREMALPPHAYLVQVRVTQAKALLKMGLPIAQVACDTGFTDQSHLNRHFKRLVGMTPKQYLLGYQPTAKTSKTG